MFRRPTIFLADDHSQFCELIADSLRTWFDIVGWAHDAPAILAKVEHFRPDIVILDVAMPLLTAIDTAMRIRESVPSAVVMFVTINEERSVATKALKIGALGFLVKTSKASELADAIWSVCDERDGFAGDGRQAQLTTREREVVQLLAQGKLMKQVADLLKVSTRTVAFHKYGVMRKLGLRSSAELVRLAIAEGLVA